MVCLNYCHWMRRVIAARLSCNCGGNVTRVVTHQEGTDAYSATRFEYAANEP